MMQNLKNDMKNLENFDPTIESPKLCTSMGYFLSKHIMFELKQCRWVMRHYTEDRCKLWYKNDLYVMTLKGDALFKEKVTGGLKNDISNLVNFHASSR